MLHALTGVGVAVAALGMALASWYPAPLLEAGGGARAGIAAVAAAVVAGPVAARFLPGRLRWVVAVQALAMAGGLFSVFLGRPAYLVFTLDRFDLVAAKDIGARDLAETKDERFRRRPVEGPAYVAALLPADERERQRLIDSALEGKDLQRFPQYYVPYRGEAAKALGRAQPLATIYSRDPEGFDRALALAGTGRDRVRWLPLRARKKDGVVLLDAVSGAPLAIVLVDPW